MADGDDKTGQLVKLALVGGAGFAAYKFVYVPWAYRQEVQRRTEEEAARLAAQGMSLTQATQQALAGACIGAAAVYKVPPSVSAGVCQGVGVLAQKGLELTAKGAVIAGKAIGSGVKTGVLAVGSGVKTGVLAVGSAAATTGKAVGTAAKFVGYTAPKAIIYDAPKAVITTVAYKAPVAVAKAVGSTVAKIFGGSSEVCRSGVGGHGGKAVYPNDMAECKTRYGITNCQECGRLFDLKTMKWPWQTPAAAPAAKKPIAKPAGMRGLGDMVVAARAAKVAAERKRRGLVALPAAAPARRRATGAEFYLRHLR